MAERNQQIFQRILLDVSALAVVGLPLLYITLWGESNKRGFYCDDHSIKNPYMESTVRSWMLYVIGLVIPFALIFVVEFLIAKHATSTAAKCFNFFGFQIPIWLFNCYEKLGVFGFGLTSCQLVVDIIKYTIGRLRPHFYDVCQPILADGSTCEDPQNSGKYIEDFSCRGENFSKRLLKETRLSFPSGHSSFTFFIMIYLIIYLDKRFKMCCSSSLICLGLQLSCIVIAIFTAMSRVYDFKHHWEDVAVGATLGTLFAIIVSYKLTSRLYNWRHILSKSDVKLN